MTKGKKMFKFLQEHLNAYDLVGVHPIQWRCDKLFNMTDEEFNKLFNGGKNG